jgi:hypothetical protein
MSLVSCPRCGDKVSLPSQAPSSALVQCPLCREEYFLSDVLIQLPPALIVVSGAAAAGEEEYKPREPASAAVSEDVFTVTGQSATVARPQLRTVSRPRRAEKSAVGEIIKVVLGGAAGLAGALLVLWWGFGVDVADLGPKVSRIQYLRFLVPAKFHDNSLTQGAEVNPLDTLDARPPTSAQNANQNKSARESKKEKPAADASESAPARHEPVPQAAKTQGKTPEDPFTKLEALDEPARRPSALDLPELKIDDPLGVGRASPESDKSKPKTPQPESTDESKPKPAEDAKPQPAEQSNEEKPIDDSKPQPSDEANPKPTEDTREDKPSRSTHRQPPQAGT